MIVFRARLHMIPAVGNSTIKNSIEYSVIFSVIQARWSFRFHVLVIRSIHFQPISTLRFLSMSSRSCWLTPGTHHGQALSRKVAVDIRTRRPLTASIIPVR